MIQLVQQPRLVEARVADEDEVDAVAEHVEVLLVVAAQVAF